MYISLPQNQFFGADGKPLANGRLFVYGHDSDTLANIYTLENADYVQSQNPVILDNEGRIPTLWFEASVVDIRLEQYLGENRYELVDTFEAGFEYGVAVNDTVVQGIDGLKDADPSLGIVNVYGYDENCVAPSRYYIWDPTCDNAADDGVVVLSNTTVQGRWILLWDDEKLPCTVYGIVPGHESNISAFLNYSDIIGQYGIRTPRIPRFLSGTYTSNTDFVTDKTVYFDDGAQFTQALFTCKEIVSPVRTCPIFLGASVNADSVAHSSWFSNVYGFLYCGAQTLYVDTQNFFTDSVINTPLVLQNKTIIGNTRLPITYDNSYLQLDNCNLVGHGILDPQLDIVKFVNTSWHDEIWTDLDLSHFDFGLVADGHRTEFMRFDGGNIMSLSDFSSADMYIACRRAESAVYAASHPECKVLRMEGRTISTLVMGGEFNTLVDCRIDGDLGYNTLVGTDVWFDNVTVDGYVYDGTTATVNIHRSRFNFAVNPPEAHTIWAADSVIGSAQTITNQQLDIIADNCEINFDLDVVTDNTTATGSLTFNKCRFLYPHTFKVKNMTCCDCHIQDQTIEIYPWNNGADYIVSVDFINCYINSAHPIKFTMVELKNGGSDLDCRNIKMLCNFLNNTFLGNKRGITAPFWTWGTLRYRYFANSGHIVTYKGNVGNCPAENNRGGYDVHYAQELMHNNVINLDLYVANYPPANTMRVFNTSPNAGMLGNTGYNIKGPKYSLEPCACSFNSDNFWVDGEYDYFDYWFAGVSEFHGDGDYIVIV